LKVTQTVRQSYQQRSHHSSTVFSFQSFQFPQKFDISFDPAITVPILNAFKKTQKNKAIKPRLFSRYSVTGYLIKSKRLCWPIFANAA